MEKILENPIYQEGIAEIKNCLTEKGRRSLHHMFMNVLTAQIGLVDYLLVRHGCKSDDEILEIISELKTTNSRALRLVKLLTEK